MTTIITLVVLVSLGIVLVDGECQTNGGPIDNCCCLGYNSNNYNVKSSGVYTIGNFCGVKCSNARVYCDTTSGGGGWTVIQRRKDGSVDFKKRDWVEYEDGFGSLYGEFWLGLRSIHCLTSEGNWELRIDYQLSNGTKSYLHYKEFSVGPAEDQYQLSISGFDSVGLTDPFIYSHNNITGMKFSSRDRDNDLSSINCALSIGGWWYRSCGVVRLNNDYNDIITIYLNYQWHALPFIEIKIRPLNCNNQ
ncbi:fibrinogen C domain-containing protein 1-like [Dysidea avara]|uniref:fibrinogen C domain-containing protein 1-like n=1 Tax=Dysidea avara TaxID=196820 RepID=UPI00332F7EC8